MKEKIDLNKIEDIKKLSGATVAEKKSGREYIINKIHIEFDNDVVNFELIALDDIPKTENGGIKVSALNELSGKIVDRQQLTECYEWVRILQ